MKHSFVAAGVAALLLAAGSAQAQSPAATPAAMPPLNFDQAAYITCKEANAMNPQARTFFNSGRAMSSVYQR